MARLPTPGGDSGSWGAILNEFLSVSLNSDGTIQPGALSTSNLSDVSISSPASGQVLTYSGSKWVNQNAPSAPVTTVFGRSGTVVAQSGDYTAAQVTGAVQVAGDIGNTASSPQVTSTHLSSALPINQGGTAAATAAGALTSLGAMPVAGGTFTGAVSTTAAALTDGATIAINAALGNVFTVTLGGNHALGTPTNPTDHQLMVVEVTQPSSGGPYTLSFSAAYEFTTTLPSPSLSTTASATDYLLFIYSATATKWRFLDIRMGY
ncbi:MAG TPA: hypothetical protein VGS28_04335 [Candidatus Saccharimonadales bacterium]|nr:hypothetical protein [Candidatus Saccharimonadales bacterium]